MALFGVIAQRILAHQPIGQVHIDVRASAERRQQAAICRRQLETADTLRFIVTGYHYGIDHVGSSSGRGGAGSDQLRLGCTFFGDEPLQHLARLHAAGINVQLQKVALGVGQQVLLLAFEHLGLR